MLNVHLKVFINYLLVIQYVYGKSGPSHDKLGRYRATRPILTQLGQHDTASNDDVISCFFSTHTNMADVFQK